MAFVRAILQHGDGRLATNPSLVFRLSATGVFASTGEKAPSAVLFRVMDSEDGLITGAVPANSAIVCSGKPSSYIVTAFDGEEQLWEFEYIVSDPSWDFATAIPVKHDSGSSDPVPSWAPPSAVLLNPSGDQVMVIPDGHVFEIQGTFKASLPEKADKAEVEAALAAKLDAAALGAAASMDVGTTAGTVAAGDDTRFTEVNEATSSALNGKLGVPQIVDTLPESGTVGQQVVLTTGLLPGLYLWNGTKWINAVWPNFEQAKIYATLWTTNQSFDNMYFAPARAAYITPMQIDPSSNRVVTLVDFNDGTPTKLLHGGCGHKFATAGQEITISIGGLTSLDEFEHLSLANNNFRRVDLRGLTKLKAADLHGNNLSLGLLLAGMANLDTLNAIYHYMTVAPDLTGCDNLVSLQLTSNSTGFSTIDITPCPKLKNVGLDKNSLTEACVNQVLATLVANGLRSGTLNIGGGTNAAPTGQGLIDKTTLVSRSWTVTTN